MVVIDTTANRRSVGDTTASVVWWLEILQQTGVVWWLEILQQTGVVLEILQQA